MKSSMTFSQFKKLNQEKGFHWFEPETMSFFQTELYENTWDNLLGLFITSEVNPSGEKKFSVRQANFETGNVKTIGSFHSYNTLEEAQEALDGSRIDL